MDSMSATQGGIVAIRPTTKGASTFDRLAADILRASGSSGRPKASHGVRDEIRVLTQQDYGQPLRRMLGLHEVRQIIREARKTVWPRLNDESVRVVSPSEFTRQWSGLGVQFQLARLNGEDGHALFGFYVRKVGGSRLPLICVNTAHHPVAIGATFSHEMGHHLTGRLFDSRNEHAQFLTYTAYGEHLVDPHELAADLLVSLGVFPNRSRERFL